MVKSDLQITSLSIHVTRHTVDLRRETRDLLSIPADLRQDLREEVSLDEEEPVDGPRRRRQCLIRIEQVPLLGCR